MAPVIPYRLTPVHQTQPTPSPAALENPFIKNITINVYPLRIYAAIILFTKTGKMAQKAYYPFEIRIEYNNIETVMVVRRATENKHKFYGRIKTNDLTGIEPDIIIEKKESWIPAETWQKPATKYMKDDACIQLVGAAIDIHMVRNHSYRQ